MRAIASIEPSEPLAYSQRVQIPYKNSISYLVAYLMNTISLYMLQ